MNDRYAAYCSVAIDGPSGAGKSTQAKRLAKHFGWIYVDTGAIYRAVGLAAYRKCIDPCDEDNIRRHILPDSRVELIYSADGVQRTFLNGEDVSDAIRVDIISRYASDVSALPSVRAFLLELQRDMAKNHSVVMDGRDIGTVVLPDADVKVFLTAAPEIRAARRRLELERRGESKTLQEVLDAINARDANDSARAAAPLKRAADAVLLDCSAMSEDAVFTAIKGLVENCFSNRCKGGVLIENP
ncbi:MAG: (d)CMP kinase [Oscillospiraceae bacterium]|jgi:cytidylate kinase|nr:(d)CMP kinase [Oscillospiraceae bacterium]